MAQHLSALLLLLSLLLAVVVENLRSQLRAERRQNVELKRTIESLINSQQQSSIRLAFYEEEQGPTLSIQEL